MTSESVRSNLIHSKSNTVYTSPRSPKTPRMLLSPSRIIEAPFAPALPQKPTKAARVLSDASPVAGAVKQILNLDENDSYRSGTPTRSASPSYAESLLTNEDDEWRYNVRGYRVTQDSRGGAQSPQSDCIVPPLRLTGLSQSGLTDDLEDEAIGQSGYVFDGKLFSIAELNGFFGKSIPSEHGEIDQSPGWVSRPFRVSPEQLENLEKNEQEKEIALGQVDITDDTLEKLIQASSKKNGGITGIILYKCSKIRQLGFLTAYPQIKAIAAFCCDHLDPHPFIPISDYYSWNDLHSLELRNTAVTDDAILDLPELPSLFVIDLSHCKNITYQSVRTLKQKHPNLKHLGIDGLVLSETQINEFQSHYPDVELIGKPVVKFNPIGVFQPGLSPESQLPENNIHLRKFIYELTKYRVNSWNDFNDLEKYIKDIESFFIAQLRARDLWKFLPHNVFLNDPNGWVCAGNLIEKHERRNLEIIMSVLIPLVRLESRENKIKTTPADLDPRNEREAIKEIKKNCFIHYWELSVNPEMLKGINKLDFSNRGLTEIPWSFCDLFLTQLTELSFSNNRAIKKLPSQYIDESGRVRHPWQNFSSLRRLDCSYCSIESIENIFYYDLSPSKRAVSIEDELKTEEDEDKKRMKIPVLLHLNNLDLRGNQIRYLPQVFALSPLHGEKKTEGQKIAFAKDFFRKDTISHKEIENLDAIGWFSSRVTLDFRENRLVEITPETLEDLGKSKIHIQLMLYGNKMGAQIPPKYPENVHPSYIDSNEQQEDISDLEITENR